MKTLLSLFFVFVAGTAAAQTKDAGKAVFNVITYNHSGNILHSGYGFFIGANGVGLAPYSLFEGAYRAEVIDAKGKKIGVRRILGANSNYDLVKFTVESATTPDYVLLPSGDAQAGTVGTKAEVATYSTAKKGVLLPVSLTKADAYNAYKYYAITASNDDKWVGCPLVTEKGIAIGLVQKNFSKDATTAYAIDTRFANDLTITTTSIFNSDLRKIHLPKALPENEKDALSYIYMLNAADSVQYVTALNDFIAAYPDNAEGYVNRGNFYASCQQFPACETDYETAMQKGTKATSGFTADAVHYAKSKLMYQLAAANLSYKDWNFGTAFSEAQRAYELQPNPLYLAQQGDCLLGLKDYPGAYRKYMELNRTEFSSPASYYSAAQALEMDKGNKEEVLALLDSAVAKCARPYTQSAAQYLLARARYLAGISEHRKAVADYNEYEKIIGPKNLTDQFYFLREQSELRARMFQQALDDIHTAMSYRSENFDLYLIEQALIYLQAGEYDSAIAAAKKSIERIPQNADCYKIMGIAYGELKQKAKALEYLNKAKELGAEDADTYIRKYK